MCVTVAAVAAGMAGGTWEGACLGGWGPHGPLLLLLCFFVHLTHGRMLLLLQQAWLEKHGPVHALVDGANVALFGQNWEHGGFSWGQIKDVTDHLTRHHPDLGRRVGRGAGRAGGSTRAGGRGRGWGASGGAAGGPPWGGGAGGAVR